MLNIKYSAKTLTQAEVDYKYYLGENYLKEYIDPKKLTKKGKVSTMVANHSSMFDINLLGCILNWKVSFIAGLDILKTPGFKNLCKGNQSILIPRGGTKDALEKTIGLIEERQLLVERGTGF